MSDMPSKLAKNAIAAIRELTAALESENAELREALRGCVTACKTGTNSPWTGAIRNPNPVTDGPIFARAEKLLEDNMHQSELVERLRVVGMPLADEAADSIAALEAAERDLTVLEAQLAELREAVEEAHDAYGENEKFGIWATIRKLLEDK